MKAAIEGLGVVRINGTDKLIVSPWAAIGTDALLIGATTALFFSTRSTFLKIGSGVGAVWGVTAVILEIVKLAGGRPEQL